MPPLTSAKPPVRPSNCMSLPLRNHFLRIDHPETLYISDISRHNQLSSVLQIIQADLEGANRGLWAGAQRGGCRERLHLVDARHHRASPAPCDRDVPVIREQSIGEDEDNGEQGQGLTDFHTQWTPQLSHEGCQVLTDLHQWTRQRG